MPGNIFISYRREDASTSAVAICQYLERAFGRSRVFIDVDMRAGSKFPEVLEHRLAECKVLLALMGPKWLDAQDEAGNRRLDDPNDWVRLEIARALKRDITVIPVCVEGGNLPKKGALPEDIQGVVDHQSVTVTTTGFRNEMAGLARDIRAISNRPRQLIRIVAAAVALLLVGTGIAFYSTLRSPSVGSYPQDRAEPSPSSAASYSTPSTTPRTNNSIPGAAPPPATTTSNGTASSADSTSPAETGTASSADTHTTYQEPTTALHDGVYSGDMCYDPGRDDPARCFPTGAILERGRMSGKWPHRSPGVNWILVGEVSPIGEAKIQIVAKNALGESIGESIG
jgi:hypothetical protein